jgi:hypothetical protein
VAVLAAGACPSAAQTPVIAQSNAARYGIGNLITRASADFDVPCVCR